MYPVEYSLPTTAPAPDATSKHSNPLESIRADAEVGECVPGGVREVAAQLVADPLIEHLIIAGLDCSTGGHGGGSALVLDPLFGIFTLPSLLVLCFSHSASLHFLNGTYC